MPEQEWNSLIKKVAEEQGFIVSEGASVYTITDTRWHSVAFQMRVNSAGYIQAHQWEDDGTEYGKWGRAVYSIRDYSGAALFCQILINSVNIQAGVPAK